MALLSGRTTGVSSPVETGACKERVDGGGSTFFNHFSLSQREPGNRTSGQAFGGAGTRQPVQIGDQGTGLPATPGRVPVRVPHGIKSSGNHPRAIATPIATATPVI